MKTALVAQNGKGGATLAAALRRAASDGTFDRLDVAVAYATLQGLKALEGALMGLPPVTRWVVGLDDAITQPEAIEYLLELSDATLRLAALAPARRFHPKLYCLWSSTQQDRCVVVIGSGNMTLNGLRHNGEAAVMLDAETIAEADSLKQAWLEMWQMGKDATKIDLNAYRAVHLSARKTRKKFAVLGVSPPESEPDDPVVDDNVLDNRSTTALVELGNVEGGTLDLPRQVMSFLDTDSTIGPSELFQTILDEESARLYFEAKRWPKGAVCPACGEARRIGMRKGGYRRCDACLADFTVRTATIFERSHVPLRTWLYAMCLLVTAHKRISSIRLGKQIGVSQTTAWYILQRLGEACGVDSKMLANIAEGTPTDKGLDPTSEGSAAKLDTTVARVLTFRPQQKGLAALATKRRLERQDRRGLKM